MDEWLDEHQFDRQVKPATCYDFYMGGPSEGRHLNFWVLKVLVFDDGHKISNKKLNVKGKVVFSMS